MGKRVKGEERVDAFLPILQQNILTLQDERTQALRGIEALKSRIAQIEQDIEIMEAEREIRTYRPNTHIPDFPDKALSSVGEKIEEPEYDDAPMEEEVEHQDFFDNSEFCTPGHMIFGRYEGINAPLKSPRFQKASRQIVRDWVVNWGHDWFMPRAIIADTGFSGPVVRNRLNDLKEMDIVIHNGRERGGSKWKYNEDMPRSPSRSPRGEPKIEGMDAEKKATGTAVPKTKPRAMRTRRHQSRTGMRKRK